MDVSLRDLALFTHIFAAAILIGTSAITPLLRRRILSASSRANVLSWTESFGLVTRANPLVAIVLLASGVWLGAAGWWSQGWFAVSVAAWIMSAGLAGGVVKPALSRIAAAASTNLDMRIDAELEGLRTSRGWHVAENVLLASDLAILWIMIAKPETAVAVAILAAGTAAFAGSALLPRHTTIAP